MSTLIKHRLLNFQEKILSDAAAILDDVGEDFRDLRLIASRFEGWKARYPGAYRDAYAALSFQKIVGPLIKLQVPDLSKFNCIICMLFELVYSLAVL